MGLFNKNDNNEQRAPRSPGNVLIFRLLAVGYVGYLCVQMVQTYLQGGPDAPSLTMLIASIAVLGGGAIFLAALTYKEYKRSKIAYEAYMADLREEAEAKRAEEEAAAAAQAEEDAYYDALEAAEAEDSDEDTEA